MPEKGTPHPFPLPLLWEAKEILWGILCWVFVWFYFVLFCSLCISATINSLPSAYPTHLCPQSHGKLTHFLRPSDLPHLLSPSLIPI